MIFKEKLFCIEQYFIKYLIKFLMLSFKFEGAFKVCGTWHHVIISFAADRFSQPTLVKLVCWNLLNDTFVTAFEEKVHVYLPYVQMLY